VLPARPDRRSAVYLIVAGAASASGLAPARAATASELAQDARTALARLYAAKPETKAWGRQARAVLVFPSIVKAGFLVGGQGGEGAMLVNDKAVGFYRIAAGSFGLQAGAQRFSYIMFFMTQAAVDYAKSSSGWSVGSGPSVVMVDEGAAKSMNTTTMRKDIYAVIFGQHGLMAGMGLEGSKISRITPKP
jgi:lipid-binding SYLF domain-containing protein